jgi:dTDP-4-amino-4,6-dideoxygalactose transaminase
MNVPFLDLRAAYLELQPEIDAASKRVLDGGWYIRGGELESFEREFAAYCGARHCVGLSNGLDALHLVLRAWDIGPGDEVIVPAHTFIATWLAVSYCGATIVPVETDPATFNIDPARVEAAITSRTRAIIPVHLYGQTADVDPLMALAEQHGLKVLEDAAQAQGATYHDRKAGTLGHAAAFSFYPGKNLGAFGDAGAITTDDDRLAQRVRELANYGSSEKYVHEEKGFNCRLDEMQAAFLRVRLRVLEAWNERRRACAARYLGELAGAGGVVLPRVPQWTVPAWHLFVVLADDRDALQQSLAAAGVATLIHYPIPPFSQRAYSDFNARAEEWPIATAIARQALSLPIGPHLTSDQITTVIEAINRR